MLIDECWLAFYILLVQQTLRLWCHLVLNSGLHFDEVLSPPLHLEQVRGRVNLLKLTCCSAMIQIWNSLTHLFAIFVTRIRHSIFAILVNFVIPAQWLWKLLVSTLSNLLKLREHRVLNTEIIQNVVSVKFGTDCAAAHSLHFCLSWIWYYNVTGICCCNGCHSAH